MNRKTALTTAAVVVGLLTAASAAGISLAQSLSEQPGAANHNLPLSATNSLSTASISDSLPALPNIDDNSQLATGDNDAPASSAAISENAAERIVKAATSGTILDSEDVIWNGVSAYAVSVKRTDNSIITGFVDRATGTIFDWKIESSSSSKNDNWYDDDDNDRDYDDDDDDDYDDDHDSGYDDDDD